MIAKEEEEDPRAKPNPYSDKILCFKYEAAVGYKTWRANCASCVNWSGRGCKDILKAMPEKALSPISKIRKKTHISPKGYLVIILCVITGYILTKRIK